MDPLAFGFGNATRIAPTGAVCEVFLEVAPEGAVDDVSVGLDAVDSAVGADDYPIFSRRQVFSSRDVRRGVRCALPAGAHRVKAPILGRHPSEVSGPKVNRRGAKRAACAVDDAWNGDVNIRHSCPPPLLED